MSKNQPGRPPAQPAAPPAGAPPAGARGPAPPAGPAPGDTGGPDEVPHVANPQALPYGQHLIDRGPKGPTKESTKKRLGFPATLSIILSSIYAAILAGGVVLAVLGFIAAANVIEMERNTGSGGITGKGARAQKLAADRKKEAERKEQEYQSARRALFASFGIGLVMSFTALTGQLAGIVSGLNMVKLQSYRWAFWANLFAAIPFVSTYYLILYLVADEADKVGGAVIIIMFIIVYGLFDLARMGMSFFCFLALLGKSVRKFFEIR